MRNSQTERASVDPPPCPTPGTGAPRPAPTLPKGPQEPAASYFHEPAPFRHALSENEIQRAVFDHLKTRGAAGIVAFHPKNGGIHQRGRRRGINAGLGVTSGASDVIVLAPAGFFALELKTETGKPPTIEQLSFLDRVRAAGGRAEWCRGLDAALEILEGWGLLKGRKG